MNDTLKQIGTILKYLLLLVLAGSFTYTMFTYNKRLIEVEKANIQIGEIHKEIEGYQATIKELDNQLTETNKALGVIGLEISRLKQEEQKPVENVPIPQAIEETRQIIGSEEVLPEGGKISFSEKAFLLNYDVLTDYITRGKIIEKLDEFADKALEANANLAGQNLVLQEIQGKLQEELRLERSKGKANCRVKPAYVAGAFLAGVAIGFIAH